MKRLTESKFPKFDRNKLELQSIKTRTSKVKVETFAKKPTEIPNYEKFLDSLPKILAAKNLNLFLEEIKKNYNAKGKFILAMGAHPIKCGLSPILIKLIEKGVISAIATNGATIIHDAEIALFGETSEDVARELETGTFGFTQETGDFLNRAINSNSKLGLGEAVGKSLFESNPEFLEFSLVAKAYQLNVPFTTHVAIGTDVIHQHPSADGERIGEKSYTDFLIFAEHVKALGEKGGIFMNLGSAVLMPEVFLKAFSMSRNLGIKFENLVCANFDMINSYRVWENVLKRPGGKFFNFIGHHEIMIPLLYAGIESKIFDKNES